jgi:hypothetical protein
MLRGGGKDFTEVICALTRLGVDALHIPCERLRELLDVMERADFTHWLLEYQRSGRASATLREELRVGIERMIEESRSRTEAIKVARGLMKAHK